MADISKIKLANGTLVTLKDAQGRTNMTTLLGGHELGALGAAAWKAVATEISGNGLVEASVVKAYVDAQIETIPSFDVVVVADGKDLPTASADTFHKIYLKKEGLSGTYAEYITYKNGDAYVWERIGVLDVDLDAYVKKTTTIAGIDLNDNITVPELQQALQLGGFAYVSKGEGTVAGQTISGVKATGTSTGDISVELDHTGTAAGLTKGNFTPSGEIKIDNASQANGNKVLKGGSISVTLKDATAASEATLTRGDYKPAGSVSLTKDENGAFQVAGTNSSSEVTVNTSDDTFVKSLKAGDVDAASIDTSKFNGGSAATWTGKNFTAATYTHSGFSGGSLSKGDAVKATTEGLVASVGSGADAETLIFTAAATADTMSHGATFTPAEYGTDDFDGGSIEWGTFNGGSAASISAGFFTAQKLPVVDGTASALTGVTSASAAPQTFTGSKYAPSFEGTTETGLKVTKAEYVKPVINTATFTGTEATLGFSGTEAVDVLVTGVTYDKASVKTAEFTGKAIELDVGDIVVSDTTVEVSPKA